MKGKEESTRLNKYFNGDSDGIVLAKAAIDRLLANGDNNLSIEIREGRISRNKAVKLVEKHNHQIPMQEINNFCKYLNKISILGVV